MGTSSTFTLNIGPKKEKGWCENNGVEHSWEDGPTLTVNPPIATRECVNCGKRQYLSPSTWIDT